MTVDVSTFRAQFPEWTQARADDAAVNRALGVAKSLHNVRELATLYATAHILELEARRADGGRDRRRSQ